MTVKYDFDKHIYSGTALGEQFSNKLELVREEANVVVFKSNDTEITCQIQKDSSILLTKEGGIPILLTQSKQ